MEQPDETTEDPPFGPGGENESHAGTSFEVAQPDLPPAPYGFGPVGEMSSAAPT